MRALVLAVLLFLLSASGAYAWAWPVQGPVLVGFVFDASHPYAGGQHRADPAHQPRHSHYSARLS